MRTFTFSVSCPDGHEFHEELKRSFPNLSSKVMDYLKGELMVHKKTIQDKAARDKWLLTIVYPNMHRLFKIHDAFSLIDKENEVVETMKQNGLTITEQDAATLINKFQNECNDKGY